MHRTAIGELVLVYVEDSATTYARVEAIEPDHKPGWYHVSLLFLEFPMQEVTWILRGAYIDGTEFTMGGKRIRLEKVSRPVEEPDLPVSEPEKRTSPSSRDAGSAKVISLADRQKGSSGR